MNRLLSLLFTLGLHAGPTSGQTAETPPLRPRPGRVYLLLRGGCTTGRLITGGSSSVTEKGTVRAGGVAGDTNMGATLTACHATDCVSGRGTGIIHVGGVTGENIDGALVACCHVTRAVGGPNGTTGGVTGQNYKDRHVGRRHPDCLLLGKQSGKRHRQQSVRHRRRNHQGGWTDAMGT